MVQLINCIFFIDYIDGQYDYKHESIKYRSIRQIIQMKMNNLVGIENIHLMDILKLIENNVKGKKYIMGNKFTIEVVNKNIAIIY